MKILRYALVVTAIISITALFVAGPFVVNGYSMCGKCGAGKSDKCMKDCCNDMKKACESKIKTLRDSASALQGTNPDLAKGLNDLADQKAKKMQEWADRQAMHDAKTKLLTDSAAAIEKTNPALAKELKKMSEYKNMGKGWEKRERHDEDKE